MSNYRGNSILDLSPHMGKRVRVRFQGGREVVGVLRGYDPMVNIVIDDTVEHLRSSAERVRRAIRVRVRVRTSTRVGQGHTRGFHQQLEAREFANRAPTRQVS